MTPETKSLDARDQTRRDAWVVGGAPCAWLDCSGGANYAQPAS